VTSSSDSGQAPVPRVSVCLPVWQGAELVRIVIGGVLAQTEQDWELVVVDNASDDGLANVIAQYGEPRIRYHRYEEHVEAYRNLNRTIELARAQWVLPIGADDRLDPDALARLLEAAEAGGADRGPRPVMVAAPCRRVFPDGTPADASYYGSQSPTPVHAGVYDAAAWLAIGAAGGPFEWNIGGILFDRAVLVAGGSFRPEVGLAADQEVILRMAAHGPVAYLDGPVVDVMVRPESEGNQRWLTERRDAAGLTPLAAALLAALAAHEQVRAVDPRERRDLMRGAARTHLVRAAQHRTLAGGQGRAGAIADLRRAARLSPGALLRPSHAALAVAALIAPSALLRWVSNRLRDRQHRDQPPAGM
jgi:glycosyltransferase involved in cell wall biosynthesis